VFSSLFDELKCKQQETFSSLKYRGRFEAGDLFVGRIHDFDSHVHFAGSEGGHYGWDGRNSKLFRRAWNRNENS